MMYPSNNPQEFIPLMLLWLFAAQLLWFTNLKNRLFKKSGIFKETAEKYQKIFNSAMDSFIILDKEGNILDLNTEAEKMFECQYSELIKLSAKDILHPDYYTSFERFMKEVYYKGYSQCELLNVRRDGSTFFADLRGTRFEHQGQLNLFAIIREITKRKQMERWTRYILAHDPLTGLYNRAYFEEEISKLERGRIFPVSIIMVDVDGMKSINDSQGHKAGDKFLRRASQVLRISFRSEDVVARVGGDEFAILLPGADSRKAREALLRLSRSISEDNSKEQRLRLNLSFGAATGYQGANLSKVLEEADMHMYEHKFSKMRDLEIGVPDL